MLENTDEFYLFYDFSRVLEKYEIHAAIVVVVVVAATRLDSIHATTNAVHYCEFHRFK